MLKDFRVTDSLGLKDFRVKGIWRLHDLGVKPSSACCELRMLQRDRVQKKYGCWYAIVRSEKTHTLARNEFQVLMCHHAVRKDTHAGLQRILRHAMNYGCGSAIVTSIQAPKHKNITIWNTWIYQHDITIPSVILKKLVVCGGCNEWWLLIRHRAVRKDTHAGLQRIPSAGWPSCDQKRHTRWHATNSGWCCALVPSETCQRMLGLKDIRVKQN